jgi:hypothetical protein
MSYGIYTWELEELTVFNALDDKEPKKVNVEFVLVCTDPGTPESGRFGPPEFYDPGEAPTWEIESIQIIFENSPPLGITENQFMELFPRGDSIIDMAIECALDNGIVESDYE